MISIKSLTKENWNTVRKLELTAAQSEYLPSNVVSIAQSKVYPNYIPEVIYHDDEVVGFILSGISDKTNHFLISRFMIDSKFQGKGYGKEALKMLIDKTPQAEIYTSVEKENEFAYKFFTFNGFEDTGELDHEELVLVYKK